MLLLEVHQLLIKPLKENSPGCRALSWQPLLFLIRKKKHVCKSEDFVFQGKVKNLIVWGLWLRVLVGSQFRHAVKLVEIVILVKCSVGASSLFLANWIPNPCCLVIIFELKFLVVLHSSTGNQQQPNSRWRVQPYKRRCSSKNLAKGQALFFFKHVPYKSIWLSRNFLDLKIKKNKIKN